MSDEPKKFLYVLSEEAHCCGYTVLAVCDSVERAKEIAAELADLPEGKELPWKEYDSGFSVDQFSDRTIGFYPPPYDIERFELNVNPKDSEVPVPGS